MNTTIFYLEKSGKNKSYKQLKIIWSYIWSTSQVQIEFTLLINLLGFGDIKSSKGRVSVVCSSLKKITYFETNLFVQLAGSVFCCEPGCDQHNSTAITDQSPWWNQVWSTNATRLIT